MPQVLHSWGRGFWQQWGWLVLLIGALAAAAVWVLFPACVAWFLLGYALAVLVVAAICLFLYEPPPPPPPGKRFRLINCDRKQHLKKLKLWTKREPIDPNWRQNPHLVYDVDLPFGAHFEFDPNPDALCFGIYAELEYHYFDDPSRWGEVRAEDAVEQQEPPIQEATLHYVGGPIFVIAPNQIIEACPG